MFKAYTTTYGSLINIDKVIDKLKPYINTVDLDNLEYEYPSNKDIKSVFITGYNVDERDLPIWEHPLNIRTLRGNVVIVNDVRRYLKKVEEQPVKLSDVVRDGSSLEFITTRALLTRNLLEGDLGDHRVIFKPSTTALSIWITSMISTIISLDPVDLFAVEIISSVYANTLYYDRKDVDKSFGSIVARVTSSKHQYKLNKKEVLRIANEYTVTKTGGLKELIINIQNILDDKGQFVTIDSLLGVMGNVWYGPGDSETPIIALEEIATWNAMLYSVIDNRSYAKSRIGTLLNRNSRTIDSKVIQKHISNFIKENTI